MIKLVFSVVLMRILIICSCFVPCQDLFWNVVCCTFGLSSPPADIHQLFTIQIDGFARTRKLVLVGLVDIFWRIWKMCNSACFRHQWPAEPVLVIHNICCWINLWGKLQKVGEH